jgi:hypothetical protein
MKFYTIVAVAFLSLGIGQASADPGDQNLKTPEGVQKFFNEISRNSN